MVTELGKMLTAYSPVNRTRCFAHILNLVAKSLLKQFDVKPANEKDDDLNDDEQSLLALADDIEQEELNMAKDNDAEDDDIEEEDDVEGWVDEVAALTADERENLQESVRPVKRTLVKVWSLNETHTSMT
jgi:hypothetical protein